MYRTTDPRFRRRLNEIGQTLENANESAQSNIYIFGQNYVKPCLGSVADCFTQCIDASCPSLNLSQRDRVRRQRAHSGRGVGRAELSFDFYDDWDDDENDGLLGGWGNDDFDRLVAGGGSVGAGYGTIANAQPGRQRRMSYSKARRKSAGQKEADPTVVPGSSFLGKLFGGKSLKYKPSAAGLQEHPGARRIGRDLTEGEALLEGHETDDGMEAHRRVRSGTVNSGHTTDSYSSRGDLFPSDEEDDAIPLDDEFAMVLERRTTMTGAETESSSNKTSHQKSKRPLAGSRTSTRRTVSSRSDMSSNGPKRVSSRTSSLGGEPAPMEEAEDAPPMSTVEEQHVVVPTMSELIDEEEEIEAEEEQEVSRKRLEAQKLAVERGLAASSEPSSKAAASIDDGPPPQEPSQLPTPVPTDDEEEEDNASRSVADVTAKP